MKQKKSKGPLTPQQRARYEESRRALKRKLWPIREAIKESERLTAADYALRINC